MIPSRTRRMTEDFAEVPWEAFAMVNTFKPLRFSNLKTTSLSDNLSIDRLNFSTAAPIGSETP